jgi:hypothetical protein
MSCVVKKTCGYVFGVYQQSVVFTGVYDYDTNAVDTGVLNFYTHRENIIECLHEFSVRDTETAKYLIGTFGFTIEVVNPVHYSLGEATDRVRPHFNIKANGKNYHIFTTKNNRRIVGISEVLYKDFPF